MTSFPGYRGSDAEAREIHGAVKYKIHAVTSVNGEGRSANNNKFYDTYEDAEAQVQQYLRKNEGVGFVIMKTVSIFMPIRAPIATYMVRDSGLIEEV